jgi:hypothetical protein
VTTVDILPLLPWFIGLSIVCSVIAAIVAPSDRTVVFFFATLVIGPLGLAAALVAQPRNSPWPADGRKREICPRCVVNQDIPEADVTYTCWQCGEEVQIEEEQAPSRPASPFLPAQPSSDTPSGHRRREV